MLSVYVNGEYSCTDAACLHHGTMETIGHSTLLDNFANLTGSALDPGSLADELFQRNLINKAIAGEASSPYVPKTRRLHAIVMAVMGNGSPDAFKAFVEAVRKDQASAWLAQALIGKGRQSGIIFLEGSVGGVSLAWFAPYAHQYVLTL